MESKYIKFLILAIEIVVSAVLTKFFQNMVYTDIILIILILAISFYIALHYEFVQKQKLKWLEFKKIEQQNIELNKKLESQNQKLKTHIIKSTLKKPALIKTTQQKSR